jgi:hypothetical protein
MTWSELYDAAHTAHAKGHRYIQIQMRKRRRPRNWDRVRVYASIYGRCIGECDQKGVYLIDVPLDQFWPAEHKSTAA